MQDHSRDTFYRIAWWVSRSFYDLFFPVEVFGGEHVPARGPFLIAANHASFLDPPAIGVAIDRDLAYFARKSLFRGPFDRLLRRVHAIPVDREGSDVAAMKGALRTLRNGLPLVLFPEGTRSPDGSLQPARRGIGLLAVKAQVPVLPCRIFGSGDAWGRNRPPQPGTPLCVGFGPLLQPEALRMTPGTGADPYQFAVDRIMAAIGGLRMAPDGGAPA